MYFGTYLGIYMILKFILFPLAFIIPFLSFLFLGLTLAVPFVSYYYLKTYRNKAKGGYINFWEAYSFCIRVYFYASLLVAIAHFIYFQYIDQGFIIDHLYAQVNTLLEAGAEHEDFEALKESLMTTLDNFASLSPRDLTFNNLSFNITFGFIIGIPTALLVRKKNIR